MSKVVLFQLTEWDRRTFINRHLFYVEEAMTRLLPPFENLDAEAHKKAEEHLARNRHRFDPDRSDPADFCGAAWESAMDYCGQLIEMREQVVLSIVTAVFHRWEKELRDWLTTEVRHWISGETVIEAIWKVKFEGIMELLECIGWSGQSEGYFKEIDACRLVVNVYKHGFGASLKDLAQKYPVYLPEALTQFNEGEEPQYTSCRQLIVNDADLRRFSEAIVSFWKSMPTQVDSDAVSSFPSWFEKACN